MKKLIFILALVVSFVSCIDENTYKYNPDFDLEYATNFVKKYGYVDSSKDWDMTKENMKLIGTRATSSNETKVVAGLSFAVKNTISFSGIKSELGANKALYDNIRELLPDGKKSEGSSAVLVAPSNSFTIYPVMAQGAYTYDLYIKVGDDNEVLVFSKNWTKYDKPYVNGMAISGTNSKNLVYADMRGVYVNAPIGTPIQIYIKNIKDNGKVVTNKPIGTVSGNAIVVNAKVRPEGLGEDVMPKDAVIKYIGIEDSEDFGDRDFNDLVLAVIGNPYTPEDIQITEEYYTYTTTCSKRYMIEDLGTKDDFDFNDIVVDVIDSTTNSYKIIKVNGIITSNELISKESKQRAIIRHLGGILNFKLKIGDTVLPNMKCAIDVDPNEEFTIEGWDSNTNNVIVTVSGFENDGVKTIKFPKIGDIPLIIAVDTNVKWMEERVAIPNEWCM